MNRADASAMEPHELVAIVADADVEKLLGALLIRGIERGCLRRVRWVIRRDPMRDAGVRQSPRKAIPDVKPGTTRLLVILDHDGCGAEEADAQEVEGELVRKLCQAGFSAADVCCVVFHPELETVLTPVWDWAAELMARKRRGPAPTHGQVAAKAGFGQKGEAELDDVRWHELLREHPKECFEALLRCLQLRPQPALFQEIGREVSIPNLKVGSEFGRVATRLVDWFGA